MEDSIGLPMVNGFLMVELGNFQDTMNTVCPDLCEWKTHGCTQSVAQCGRNRAKDDKISTCDMTVDT